MNIDKEFSQFFDPPDCKIVTTTSCKLFVKHCIAQLEAELAEARKDAELGKLVREKMKSGNSVPVSRCVITQSEITAIDQAMLSVAQKG